VPEILMAMDAKLEWQKATNPFGGKPKEKEKPRPMGDFIAKVIQMPGTKVHGRE
jgi:hypothetical protein